MSVLILKKGEKQYYKIECPECKSLLRYLRSDEWNEVDQFTSMYSIVCPECRYKICTRIKQSNGEYIVFDTPFNYE